MNGDLKPEAFLLAHFSALLSLGTPSAFLAIEVLAQSYSPETGLEFLHKPYSSTSDYPYNLSSKLKRFVACQCNCQAMATMAGACCLPSAAFSRTLDESCSSSSGSVFATFQTPQAVTGMCRSLKQLGLVGRGRGWLGGSSALKASSVFNSASSSFQGRICLFLTCPVGGFLNPTQNEQLWNLKFTFDWCYWKFLLIGQS